jgi:hypothetical protein
MLTLKYHLSKLLFLSKSALPFPKVISTFIPQRHNILSVNGYKHETNCK